MRNIFALMLLLSFTSSLFLIPTNALDTDSTLRLPNLMDYTVSDPIVIYSDEDFISLGFAGNGSEFNPYLIQNLLINPEEDERGIFIVSTSKFFEIRNCYIQGGFQAINLRDINSKKTVIVDNFIIANESSYYYFYSPFEEGIYVSDSSNCYIENNTFYNRSECLYLYGSFNCQIINNHLLENSTGIVLESSSGCIVKDNYVEGITMVSAVGFDVRNSNNIAITNNKFNFSDPFANMFSIYSSSIIVLAKNQINTQLMMRFGNNCLIEENEIRSYQVGLYIYDSVNIEINKNHIESAEESIYMNKFSNLSLTNNYLYNSGIGLKYIQEEEIDELYVQNNFLDGKPIAVLKDRKGLIIDDETYSQLILLRCSNVQIYDLSITNTLYYLTLLYCTDVTISNCQVTHCMYGIYIGYSDNIQIENNLFINNMEGIHARHIKNSEISNNECHNNTVTGIYVGLSEGVIIKNNHCYDNKEGIRTYKIIRCQILSNVCKFKLPLDENSKTVGIKFEYSSFCVIMDNTLDFNNKGIHVYWSFLSIFTQNYISGNTKGIYVDGSDNNTFTYNTISDSTQHGIYLVFNSYGNIIHHNNFINNNPEGESQALDEGTYNIWYDETTNEGNYWKGHSTGEYQIEGFAESTDPYPLKSLASQITEETDFRLFGLLPLLFIIFSVMRKRKHIKHK